MKTERNRSLLRYEDCSSFISIKLSELKKRLFRRLTRKSTSLFLRGGDLISVPPQVSGEWEPAIARFIESCAVEGYNDFLFDIGANIGLTSCQSGGDFKQVHMFEPNPLCVHILEVNTAISLESDSCYIHPFGLGTKDEELSLLVPKHNWGGAFIRSENNYYSNDVLSRKDGFDVFETSNYDEVKINVRGVVPVLQGLFGELGSLGLKKGMIKIDIEGFEYVVIEGIAQSIPDDFSAVLIFENLSKDFELQPILQMLNGRGSAYVLERQPPWKSNWPRWFKALSLVWNSRFVTRLVSPEDAYSLVGDIVIKID